MRPTAMAIQQRRDRHESQQCGFLEPLIITQYQQEDEDGAKKPSLRNGTDVQIRKQTEKQGHQKNLSQE